MTKLINQDPLGLPVTLSSGAVLGVGEEGEGDLTNPDDQALLETGTCRRAETIEELRTRAGALGIERRTKLSRDELAQAIADAERANADEAALAAATDADAGDAAATTDNTSEEG